MWACVTFQLNAVYCQLIILYDINKVTLCFTKILLLAGEKLDYYVGKECYGAL
jgi:hypothetical protein